MRGLAARRGLFGLVCLCLLGLAALLGSAPTALAAGDANQATCPSSTESSPGFRTYLPDCRAYEQVTPPFKNASGEANILPEAVNELFQGGGIPNEGSPLLAGFTGAVAGTANNQSFAGASTFYELTRTEAGWLASSLYPPASTSSYESANFFAASSEIAAGRVSATLWSAWGPSGVQYLYLREPGGAMIEIGPATPPADGSDNHTYGEFASMGQGVSADGKVVVFGVEGGFKWPFDETKTTGPRRLESSLYEYVGTRQPGEEREPALVGVSDGATVVNGSTLPAGTLISTCGTSLGAATTGTPLGEYHAVSASGSTVFFTPTASSGACASAGGSGPSTFEVFARVDRSRTVAISEPSPNGECTTVACTSAPVADALYAGASADGSKAFFMSTQQLTDAASEDANAGDSAAVQSGKGCPKASGTGCNLYEYDFGNQEGEKLVLVSGGDSSGLGPRVQGVVDISSDGSHVYFIARGVLATATNGQGDVAQAGADNLYVFERDARYPNGHTSFVTELCSGAGASGTVSDSRCPGESDEELWANGNGFAAGIGHLTTPGGRFLVLDSYGNLTGEAGAQGSQQLFQYDAETGALVRVSIGQNGFNHDGNTSAAVLRSLSSGPPPVLQSEDGAHVFFESAAGLTPQALNEAVIGESAVGEPHYAENIYEYHAGGVYLISDGQDLSTIGGESTVKLRGADPSGQNVFFQTADRLVPQDTDTVADVYDARVGGGFPAPAVPAGCVGDACQGPSSTPPPLTPAGSMAESSGGNVVPKSETKLVVKPKPKSLTRARKLANALKACRKKPRKRRAGCESRARKRYRGSSKAKRTSRRGK